MIERQLAHREQNEIRAAYHRTTYMADRTKLMQWWADYLGGGAFSEAIVAAWLKCGPSEVLVILRETPVTYMCMPTRDRVFFALCRNSEEVSVDVMEGKRALP